ncbi:unnamed protein product (mitochondrion) [Plasmodiophora brassicae]|uniref:Phosphoinositide phospholipase C n=1 Tax=Plasmodiophora brassicae TaxID=37360 RepID=A0A0G4ISU6_PLABS|nr:hypothetical protein PBRA_006454 [Plasmodiophora brassicae]SPQ94424.1 unnamed protein product [Plasmodiophora brassicae]
MTARPPRRRHSWPPAEETTSAQAPGAHSPHHRASSQLCLQQHHDHSLAGEIAKLDQIACLRIVQRGAELSKYGHRGPPHNRFFYVDPTGSFLQWRSRKKKSEDSMITFSDVHRLQVGQHTTVFERFAKTRTKEIKRRSFSLIYGPDHKTLDIVCESREQFIIWARALRFLISRVSKSRKIDPYRSLMRCHWDRACVRERGVIDAEAVSRLFKDLNLTCTKQEVKAQFESANVNRYDLIDFSTITRLSLRLRSSPSVYLDIFRPYGSLDEKSKLRLNAKQFQTFLRIEQRMEIDEAEASDLLSRFVSKDGGRDPPTLRIYELVLYVTGDGNTLFDPARMRLYQDMTRPLCDYFINSSHNTYLEADQIKGVSSVKMYIRALKDGCRCVEIDCWDGPNGEPIVYHGFTLTSRVLFSDVIQAIKEHAFATSPYPVILSFENHCSLSYQRRMAHHLTTILGDLLLIPTGDEFASLPSPLSLLNKIVVKAKMHISGDRSKLDSEASFGSSIEALNSVDTVPLSPASSVSSRPVSPAVRRHASVPAAFSPSDEQTGRIAPELAALVLLKASKFVSFDALRGAAPCQMTSFSEKKVAKLVKSGQAGRFAVYNSENLSRVYPSRFRVDSSNFSPIPAWNLGCQMVALNFQTLDLPMLLNYGRFLENNRSGYVLKPEQQKTVWSNGAAEPDPALVVSESEDRAHVFTHIGLTVIGAFHLPKPGLNIQAEVVDPYVKICVRGLDADCKEFRTSVVCGNGFNPAWNESFQIRINGPHCAMLAFQVFDRKKYKEDRLVAQAALPFSCMRLGYRNVPLWSATMQPIDFCCLVVHSCIVD